jgi:hypothetical protein
MAHSVEVNITNHPLSREENGIVFVVEDNEGRFGELTISVMAEPCFAWTAACAGARAASTSRTS